MDTEIDCSVRFTKKDRMVITIHSPGLWQIKENKNDYSGKLKKYNPDNGKWDFIAEDNEIGYLFKMITLLAEEDE